MGFSLDTETVALFLWGWLVFGGLIFFFIVQFSVVKKLRRNSAVKDFLGLDFVWGWATFSIAWVFGMPKGMIKKNNRIIPGVMPDCDLLYRHTTLLDRVLARILFYLWAGAITSTLFWMVVDGIDRS